MVASFCRLLDIKCDVAATWQYKKESAATVGAKAQNPCLCIKYKLM